MADIERLAEGLVRAGAKRVQGLLHTDPEQQNRHRRALSARDGYEAVLSVTLTATVSATAGSSHAMPVLAQEFQDARPEGSQKRSPKH